MADFSVTLTVPDAKLSEFIDALNWAWGEKVDEDGNPAGPKTGAELKAEYKTRSENALKDVYRRYKTHLRNQIDEDGDIDIT